MYTVQGTLKDTLAEVRPTTFLGVPRVWEKMQEAMVTAGRSNGALKRRIVTWAKKVGLRSNLAMMRGSVTTLVKFVVVFGCRSVKLTVILLFNYVQTKKKTKIHVVQKCKQRISTLWSKAPTNCLHVPKGEGCH